MSKITFSNIHFYRGYEIRQSSNSGRHFIYKNDLCLQGDNGYGDPYRNIQDAKIQIDHNENHVLATHWPTYIRDAIKTGIESPTPYEVIPYKNGRGIKKIRFIK